MSTARKVKSAKKPVRSRKARRKAAAKPAAPASSEVVTAYKGFDRDLRCRGFQFEIGKSYEHSGAVEICASGFHACEYPLDVFDYYAPATSRFAIVTQASTLARHSGDTKIASGKITITAELRLSDMIERAVKWVIDRAKKPVKSGHATGVSGAASATGVSGAASATGYSGAASATGYSGAASATGDRGAASATGVRGAASATGYRGRVQGADGCALFLVYRNSDGKILHAWAGIAGRDGIKPLTWYTLDASGKPVEA